MNYKKIITMTALFLSLFGCAYLNGGDKSFIQNRDTDYLKAQTIPPMKIPPGMSSDKIETLYPVSERDYPAATKKPSLVPPGL